MSRRRVSCRDLGRVDCDGWLLKKKDHVGFMAQKWKRCWFVLKGHTLYWYNHPNDEKAAGLLNLASYNLESTREQKKKYVFQLSHEKYKPFIFAAETLADLTLPTVWGKNCYSETEAEDPDDEAPRQGCDSVSGPKGHPGEGTGGPRLTSCPVSPAAKEKAAKHPRERPALPGQQRTQQHSQQPPGAVVLHFVPSPPFWSQSRSPLWMWEPGEEDLESLMQCLKQGGVSLIGRQRFLTQEQCRRSFVRRNKNPHINEKVHAVRALQSTLKAKLAELQALEQLLDDATLTSEKFTRWKEEHQDLYQELQECWAQRQGQDGSGEPKAEQSPPGEAAKP
uniref:Connector enhancer of kinase suppressor of Ras 1 n=1 Tax=Anas platyrhynchos TaxID=8839 RepID=A0A8B9TC06_ANAPL